MLPQSVQDFFDDHKGEEGMDPLSGLLPGSTQRLDLPRLNMTEQQIQDDGVWVIASSFTIFTMTSGFGLLESGRVSSKDEVNIMVKNVIDVIFGGLSYWMFGFGFTFGDQVPNPFIGIGQFFFDPDDYETQLVRSNFTTVGAYWQSLHEREVEQVHKGWSYASFLFQLSFATTTSTIVSAGMAERVRLKGYILLSFLLTVSHSIPAHWVWSDNGFFYRMGVIDSAGGSVVHLVGGVSGLVATLYLKPRQNRFGENGNHQMSNPTNSVLGTFMLWWGWLAFNTGSTYGVSHGKWRLAERSAIGTVMSSVGGGVVSVIWSKVSTKKIEIDMLIDGLLAALVSTTAGCLCFTPWQALVVGTVGAALALLSYPIVEKAEIDDPVGVIPVHVIASAWGMIAVGIFANHDEFNFEVTRGNNGIISKDPSFRLLIVQILAVLTIATWSAIMSIILLWCTQHSILGLRLSKYEEQLGADLREHGLAGHNIAKYKLEKKLTTKSFTSVMKAIMRWKRLTREGKARRESQMSTAGITPPNSFNQNIQSTVVDEIVPNGNGTITRRVKTKTPREEIQMTHNQRSTRYENNHRTYDEHPV